MYQHNLNLLSNKTHIKKTAESKCPHINLFSSLLFGPLRHKKDNGTETMHDSMYISSWRTGTGIHYVLIFLGPSYNKFGIDEHGNTNEQFLFLMRKFLSLTSILNEI